MVVSTMTRKTCFLALGLVLLAAGAHAQTLTGVVRDDTTAVLPGAVSTLRTAAGATVRVAATDADGRYTVSAPQPGRYTFEILLPNFRPQNQFQVRFLSWSRFTLPPDRTATTFAPRGTLIKP
jgi:hypothetical protein